MKKNYTERTIKISNILLDLENPRFPPVNDQREAIRTMLRDQGAKIVNLASDIYQNGLNPSSKLILFEDGGKYIDGDGNRRVTALKVLETPSLADADPKIRKKINSILRTRGEVPTEVGCVIFKNREEAKHWISINHSGPQDGKGQIPWNPEQKNRFEGNFTIGLQALDLLVNNQLISDGDKERVNKTTLDRVLSYRSVKQRLGIEKSGEGFLFGDADSLKKIVLALRDKKVDEVYTAEKGAAFVESVLNCDSSVFGSWDADRNAEAGGNGNTNFQPSSRGGEAYEGQSSFNHAGAKTASAEEEAGGKTAQSRTRRKDKQGLVVFGGSLSLRSGHINNLYRDIEHIYELYKSKKTAFSNDFVVIFRMSLRMLAETAGREVGKDLKPFLMDNFDQAKKSLSDDEKTSLSSQSVEKGKIVQLFQTGAHDYSNSRNEEQAVALSVILGAILRITHGRES
ncbi:hypothetical protein [Billgrantia desiderata]|uniref:hypothetical protein n=1 Tax=Billgrantia desiderata TaxID=52021 RepID=UPI00089F56A6|nr:hypothetical protein [Halomonas desiderata]SEF71171.1 hypothetical protein SAMN04487953_104144 [Halomonas desiderata]